ncbi:MAG: sulfatase-like hydrolase/transferase [Anaerolineae bacterium]|nr:sulfatase-like hydrolase/transferase [Anaerolineae bacterium]
MSTHPNILIIHADQHRYDCLGAYGNPDIRTPNIDALAADGVRYDNAFCCFPVCTPSRYSLITGLYVHQHLGWSNRCTLPAGIPTFPRLLRDAGYRTAAVGKMHYTPTYLDVGFQEMLLAEQDGAGRYDDDYHRWLRDQGLCDGVDLLDQVHEYRRHAPRHYWDTFGALPSDLDEAHHSTTWIADRACKSLASWEGDGNLLMVGFIKPHHPFDPPAPWDQSYDPASLSLLSGWTEQCAERDLAYAHGYFDHRTLTEERLRQVMSLYYATISQIDHHVGRMVDLLCQRGLYDRTAIVYTSDHGDYMGYHHMLLKGNHMYEPLVRVPLIVKYPGQQSIGTAATQLVSNVDLAPTLLACAGCEAPASVQGINLASGTAEHDLVFAEAPHAREYMVRSSRYKLLHCRDSADTQFFDLQTDPTEQRNLIDSPAYQEHVTALRRRLYEWSLFDSASSPHLDLDAPQIGAPNVPAPGGDHARTSYAYYRARMAQLLELRL